MEDSDGSQRIIIIKEEENNKKIPPPPPPLPGMTIPLPPGHLA